MTFSGPKDGVQLRELYLLSHEFGHFILHQRLKIGQIEYDNFKDSKYNFKTGRHELVNPKNWIEWQANYFASALILPQNTFLARLYWVQDRLEMRRGKIYIDSQRVNRSGFYKVVKKIAYI